LSTLLVASLAAGVPILIHLLQRRQYRIVEWAAMRFLLAAQQRTARRLRLEQLLLLLVRILAVVLLVLALASVMPWAEPLWQTLFPGGLGPAAPPGVRTHHVVVVDGSLSMSARAGESSAFERAVQQAEAVVRGAAAGDGFSVVVASSPPQILVSTPADDPERVAGLLRGLRAPHGALDLSATLTQVADVLKRSPDKFARRGVYWFTDTQRSTWRALTARESPELAAWQGVNDRGTVALVDVGTPDLDNLSVTNLVLGDGLLIAGAKTSVTATVQNFGRAERTQVRVELLVGRAKGSAPGTPDDEDPFALRTIAQELIDVPTGGTGVTVTFPHQFRTPGEYIVQVRLEPDALEADDRRSLAVVVRERVPVLLVNGKPAIDKPEQATYFLAAALNPFPDNDRNPLYPARPRVISATQFADPHLGDLTPYDCVFLCDVPQIGPREADRLEAHLRRGGGLVIGLGPRVDIESYNRTLWREGQGLLPGKLEGVRRAEGDKLFTLAADETSFTQAPLAAFRADNDRAGLLAARVRQYLRIVAPPRGPARRVLTILPPDLKPGTNELDPAVLEWPRYRGRVVVVATSLNRDWTSWPIAPSFPPFMQEVLRFVVASPNRFTATVGEPLEEFLPVGQAGLEATIARPDGASETVAVTALADGAQFRYAENDQSGLYRVTFGSVPREHLFAVNVPAFLPAGGTESDLTRVTGAELEPAGAVQMVTDLRQIVWPALTAAPPDAEQFVSTRGPAVARVAVLLVLLLWLVEVLLAHAYGRARSGLASGTPAAPLPGLRGLALVVVGLALGLGGVLLHAVVTGELLSFLPYSWRLGLEQSLGVPPAAPGEGTRWRLENTPTFGLSVASERWGLGTLAVGLLLLVGWIYRRERPAQMGRLLPSLRLAVLLLGLFVLLPQLRLVFTREGWPDVVILVDDSRSMGTVDDYGLPANAARAAALARQEGLTEPRRLQLAQALLTQPGGDWLSRLLSEKRVRVHVYSAAHTPGQIAEVIDLEGVASALERIRGLKPEGNTSPLGSAIRGVLEQYRGASLAAVVLLTDGITTEGEDVVQAGRHAARVGVPLYFVGLGASQEPRDLVLSDLQVEDVVPVNDRLVFEARVSGKGWSDGAPSEVPVVLSERKDGQLVELARTVVRLDAAGRPVKFRITYTPTEAGEKTYVLETPPLTGETESTNNRLERNVYVSDARKLRVLLIDGAPRYDFRFLKALLERESDEQRGNKTVELKTLLLDADREYAAQDKSAVADFPTREELLGFDVVVIGDVDPRHPQLGERNTRLLADFVRERGGGLLVQAGARHTPHAWRETPLADLLPVTTGEAASEGTALTAGFQLRLTPFGRLHPIFRLASDEAENAAVWSKLPGLYWHAKGYQRKPAAEVLAVHPEKPGLPAAGDTPGDEKLPLVVQQFVGAGRVLFFGFDETWRWRLRQDELRYNQFWLQTVRYLARQRQGRVEVRLDRQTPYRRGEPMRVTVRFPDDRPPPATDGPVSVRVERKPLVGEVERQTLQLAKLDGSRATYEALLTRTPEGDYRVTLNNPVPPGGPAPFVEGKVLPPPGELDRLQLNQTDLERAAAESRGKYYGLADADQLVRDLPTGTRVALNQPRPPWTLWNHPLLFVLLLAALTIEWLGRKRNQLP
jgi:hypothetical protein